MADAFLAADKGELKNPYKQEFRAGLAVDPDCSMTVQPLKNLKKKLRDFKMKQFSDIVETYRGQHTVKDETDGKKEEAKKTADGDD
jgi:hypothetical protein